VNGKVSIIPTCKNLFILTLHDVDPVLRESERYGRREGREGDEAQDSAPAAPVEKPNYSVSGALARDTNIASGVVLKYSEPLEARPPALRYRLYVFKGTEQLDVLHIHRQSSYLIGRERTVADIPADHPSLSKQHAVIQYRQIVIPDPLGLADSKEIK
jgi:smad nuclear-interacting protein 1